MVRRLPLVLAFALAAIPAQAEDFTGFYAGVTAGYGRGHEESKGTVPGLSSGTNPGAGNTTILPPSASAAAATLRHPDRNTVGR